MSARVVVEIAAVEVLGLDYHGTELADGVDIFVEGKLVKHADLGPPRYACR